MNIFSSDDDQKDNNAAAPIPQHIRKAEKVIIITADKAEDNELFYPYYRLTEEGYHVDVVTPKGGKVEAKRGNVLKYTRAIGGVHPEDYALLYIPGGKAPSELRKNEEVLRFVKEFARSNKPIAAICHGVQVLITADLVNGKQMACWPEVKDELQEAGGIFVNEALVEDGQFVTARMPGDLPRHLYGVLEYLRGNVKTSQSRNLRQTAA